MTKTYKPKYQYAIRTKDLSGFDRLLHYQCDMEDEAILQAVLSHDFYIEATIENKELIQA